MMEAFIRRDFSWDRVDILFRDRDAMTTLLPIGDFQVAPLDEGKMIKPTFELTPQMAESLFQALWTEGYRPHEFGPVAKTEAALEKHINFAEAVVANLFKRLK